MATLLHHIFQRHSISPDEFYVKPYKVRAFIMASMMTQLEAEEKERAELERRADHGRK